VLVAHRFRNAEHLSARLTSALKSAVRICGRIVDDVGRMEVIDARETWKRLPVFVAVYPEPLYSETEQGLFWNKGTQQGRTKVPIANFRARIVTEETHDNGVETKTLWQIKATLAGTAKFVTIPSRDFNSMNWVTELGPHALIYVTMKDHVRAAIQELSPESETNHERILTHTGWRSFDGVYAFLHAGGAIGPNGPLSGVQVSLCDSLSLYDLPPPPSGKELILTTQ
jgi:hypothetical protein